MKFLRRPDFFKLGAKAVRMGYAGGFPAFLENANDLAFEEVSGLKFHTPSALSQWRGRTHLTKEPGTIDWINGFEENAVFWDVGANIGVYSLYAAKHRNAQVYSFEPSPFNFGTLSQNIVLNNFSSNISAFCMALSNETLIAKLNMTSTGVGAAHTGFQTEKNEFGKALNIVHDQATLGFSMDDFIDVFKAPVPNHIKIDVDGAEPLVIAGAQKTLKNPALQSVLIELPLKADNLNYKDVLSSIEQNGFTISQEDHPDGDQRLSNFILKRS